MKFVRSASVTVVLLAISTRGSAENKFQDQIRALEAKFIALAARFNDYELSHAKCNNRWVELENLLERTEKNIKDCHSLKNIIISSNEKAISYDLKSILSAGCEGDFKYLSEKWGEGNDFQKNIVKHEMIVNAVVKDGRLTVEPIKKDLLPYEPRFGDSLGLDLIPEIGVLPPVYTDRIYEPFKLVSVPLKGQYNYKYKVMENPQQKLVVSLEGNSSQTWQARNKKIESKTTFSLHCTGKSIAELDAKAAELSKLESSDQKRFPGYGN